MTTKTDSTRTAVITGATGALGRATALRLARDGLNVVVHFQGDETGAEAIASLITERGGRAIAAGADVADAEELSSLFDRADDAFGGVDALVNSAGVSRLGPLASMSDDDYDAVFDVSVRGTLNGLRLASTRLRDDGRIVTLSTTSLAVTTPGMGVYMAAKAAVETLTRSAAKELALRGITVNAVAPGAIASPMFFEGKTSAQIEAVTAAHPAGRLGTPDDIAAAVSLLVSPDAAWISGQVIRVNGGIA